MMTTRAKTLFGILLCTIGAFFYCYEFVLRIVPGVLQTELCEAFGHISASLFGQISALYYFAYSPMQLPVGMLMDRFGPRKLLSLACLCCALGSWMFSYSSMLWIAGIGRFIIGFGSSFAFVGVLSLALHWLPKKYFSLVAGLITTLGMLGLVYGEMKITEMAAIWGLKAVLLSITGLGLALTVLIFLIIRDRDTADSNHVTSSHINVQPLSLFFKDVWRVLVSPTIWLIGLIGVCLYTSLSVFGELWGQTYLAEAHHLTKMQAASTISAMFLGWAVGAPLSGYLSDWTQNRLIPLVVGAIGALICISLVLYCKNLSYSMLNLLLFLYGVFSASEIIVFIMGKERCGIELSGTVFAAINMIVTLGGVVYQPLVGFLLDNFRVSKIASEQHIYLVSDYQRALSILPISLLFVLLIACFLINKKQA